MAIMTRREREMMGNGPLLCLFFIPSENSLEFWEKKECVDLETFTCLSLPICLQSEIKQWSPQEAGHHSGYTSPALSCPCALASGTIHPQFKSKGTARRNECKSIHPSRQPESAKRLLEPQPSTASALNLSGTLPRNLHVLPSLRDRRIRALHQTDRGNSQQASSSAAAF